MLTAIGLFLPGLFGKVISDKAARLLGIGLLVLAALAAVLISLAAHDSNLIDRHDAEQGAEIANGIIVADRDATAKQDERDAAFQQGQDKIDAGIDNAVAAAPIEARKPVGPASQSYYDTLRREQQAKKGNK